MRMLSVVLGSAALNEYCRRKWIISCEVEVFGGRMFHAGRGRGRGVRSAVLLPWEGARDTRAATMF